MSFYFLLDIHFYCFPQDESYFYNFKSSHKTKFLKCFLIVVSPLYFYPRAPKAPPEAKQALQSLPAVYQTLPASKLCSASVGALRAHSPNETFSVKEVVSSPTGGLLPPQALPPCPHSLNHSSCSQKAFFPRLL